MATTQKIQIDPTDTGLWKVKQTAEAAKKASELLQQDLEVCYPVFLLCPHIHLKTGLTA